MFVKLLIITLVLLILSLIFFGFRILLKNNGRFPDTHVGQNNEMSKRGITCAQDTNIGCNPSDEFDGCSTCGKRIL